MLAVSFGISIDINLPTKRKRRQILLSIDGMHGELFIMMPGYSHAKKEINRITRCQESRCPSHIMSTATWQVYEIQAADY